MRRLVHCPDPSARASPRRSGRWPRRQRRRRHDRPAAALRRARRHDSRSLFDADRPRVLHRRPRHQHRRRSGALPALPGPPRRAALLQLPLRVRPAGRHLGLPRAREQRRLSRSGVLRRLRPHRQAVAHRQLPADPAVLQRRHDDAVYGQRRHAGARRRDAARDPERQGHAQRLRPARAAVRSARAARHRPRRRRRDADAEPRRHGQLHDAEARRRAAVGRQLRLQQRRRGAAALRVAHQRLHDRHRVDEREEHAARRLQRLVVRQPRADARLGQPAPPRRRVRRARTRTHVALAVELGADDQLRRLHQAGAQDAGHRLLLLRLVEQRPAAAAVHDQLGAAADRAAARDHRGRSARLLDQPEPDVAPIDRLAVQRALPQLHLRQPHAGDEHHAVRHLRFDGVDDADRRSGSLRPQPDHVRRRRDVGQTEAARADGRLHAQRQRLRRADLRHRAARTCSACRPTPWEPPGPPSACNTRSARAPDRGSTKRS